MPDCSRKTNVRVGTNGDILRKATRSTGLSISIPIPWWRTTRGSIPRSRAASRCGSNAVFAETQRNGVRRRTDDRIRSEIVMRRHDGEGRRGPVRRKRCSDLGRRQSRNVAWHCHHPCVALAGKQARSRRDGAGMAFPRAFRNDARAVAAGERCRPRIDRDDKHAGKLTDRAHGVEHILEHGRCERATFLGAQA
jgi:hypothetical protein